MTAPATLPAHADSLTTGYTPDGIDTTTRPASAIVSRVMEQIAYDAFISDRDRTLLMLCVFLSPSDVAREYKLTPDAVWQVIHRHRPVYDAMTAQGKSLIAALAQIPVFRALLQINAGLDQLEDYKHTPKSLFYLVCLAQKLASIGQVMEAKTPFRRAVRDVTAMVTSARKTLDALPKHEAHPQPVVPAPEIVSPQPQADTTRHIPIPQPAQDQPLT